MKSYYDPLNCPPSIFAAPYHRCAKVIEKFFYNIDIKDSIKKKDTKKNKSSE